MSKDNLIKEMNKKIGDDLGVEVLVERVPSKNEKARKSYFKGKNIAERKEITKAIGRAVSGDGSSSVLDILNQGIANKQVPQFGESVREDRNYEELMEKSEFINLKFSTYGADGNYEVVDGDKLIILEDAEMRKFGQDNTYKQKAVFLNREICVKVLRVDGNKVYVTPAGSTEYALKHSTKELINNEISRSLSQGNNPVVFARVLKIQPNSIMVNILDADVIGFINRSNWSKLFTRTLEGLCKEGDYLQFEVIRPAEKKEGTNAKAWILSRKNIAPNPWEHVNIDTLQVGNIMVVKCMEKPAGKSYWWGVTDRLPGVEVMGDYTRNYSENKGLYVGLSYQCKVDGITKNERSDGYKVKVIPIVVADEDREKMDSLHRKFGVRVGGGR